jgi:hypothetical protein
VHTTADDDVLPKLLIVSDILQSNRQAPPPKETQTHVLYICSAHRFASALHPSLLPASMHALAAGPSQVTSGTDCGMVYARSRPDGSSTL